MQEFSASANRGHTKIRLSYPQYMGFVGSESPACVRSATRHVQSPFPANDPHRRDEQADEGAEIRPNVGTPNGNECARRLPWD